MSFLNNLITGLSLGSVYAIIALGYTMVYGISKMLNFAHGDVIMVGAYISFLLTAHAGMNAWVSLLIAIAVCTVLGILLWGAEPRMFGSIFKGFSTIHAANGALVITPESLFTILANILIMILLTLFVNKTKAGKAMRAVSEDNGAAQLMGINVNQSISLTFAIGSGLAAIAGVLMCSAYPVLMPTTGAMPGIKAFTAAVFGGIGSIPGAMIGGLILGVIEIVSRAYISSELTDAIVFACLIIVLLIKPTGLLGKKVSEKV